ncbi:hypothetical protein GF337_18385 [candidate division KSB1 bacterium]|nr:hypothetical protein [candidate division KSB1 bacterium]
MKKISVVLLILVFVSISFAQEKYEGQTIEQILELPEEEIDLGLACLIIAKEAYPNLNIEFFDYALNYMAGAIKILNQDNSDHESRIALLNHYLFVPGNWNDSITFTFDFDDIEGKQKSNRYLNGLIATKKGCCVTLPMLYLVLADRLGWPIYPVRAPQHFFCRYIIDSDSNKYYNIETTSKGMILDDWMYVDEMKITKDGLKNGCYLRTLTKKEYFASMVHNHVQLYWTEKGIDMKNSFRCLNLAIAYDSLNCEAYWHLGNTYFFQARNYERLMLMEKNSLAIEQETLTLINRKSHYDIGLRFPSGMDYQNRANKEAEQRMKPSNPFQSDFINQLSSQAKNPSHQIQNHQQQITRLPEIDIEMMSIEDKYIPRIKESLEKSEFYKNKAKELGMVFETTREFYSRQADKKLEYDLKHNK